MENEDAKDHIVSFAGTCCNASLAFTCAEFNELYAKALEIRNRRKPDISEYAKEVVKEIIAEYRAGNTSVTNSPKIIAIKWLKERANIGLKDAKDAIEAVPNFQEFYDTVCKMQVLMSKLGY